MTEEELASLENLRGSLGIAVSHLKATLVNSAMVAAEGEEAAFQHGMYELEIVHRLLAKRRDEVESLLRRFKEEKGTSVSLLPTVAPTGLAVGASFDGRF